jgi:hypothetical protein
MTMGGRWGTQWGSAAVREHGEGEGGQNLGKKCSEGGCSPEREDGGTPARFHRREGGFGARGRWWASPTKEGGGVLGRGQDNTEGVGALMVLRLFYRRRLCSDREGKWGGGGEGGEGRHAVA